MPIRGLTKRGASFPEIGRIRKGAPKTEKGYVGKDLDHFRFVFDEAEVETAQVFHKIYGETPRKFRALLPFDAIEECWSAWLEAYVASGLIYRSDGEKVIFWVDPETGERKVFDGEPVTECIAAKGEPVGYYVSQKGKKTPVKANAIGRLKVIVPDLRRFAFMTLVTTSQYDIANIDSQLEGVELAANIVGRGGIAGVPLMISRRKAEITVPNDDGTRFKKETWLINIEADPKWAEAQAVAMIAEATPQVVEGRYLVDDEEIPLLAEIDDLPPHEGYSREEAEQEPLFGPETDPPVRQPNQWEAEILDALVKLKLVNARQHATARLNHSLFFTETEFGKLNLTDAVHYMLIWDQLDEDFPEAETETKAEMCDQAFKVGDEVYLSRATDLLASLEE